CPDHVPQPHLGDEHGDDLLTPSAGAAAQRLPLTVHALSREVTSRAGSVGDLRPRPMSSGRRGRPTSATSARPEENDMGQLVVTEFATLDGVAQAPGGPDEDRDAGFAHGGWQAPYVDET